ncbi:YDG domain-containing protein, partial [Aquitalea aquatica]
AGSNKAVSVSGYTLSGSDAGNYTVVQPTGLTANINKANLNVSGVTASDKTYDGSASASLSGTAAVSAIGSDVVSVSGTGVGSFADKNAGSNKSVSVSGYTLSGSDAGNYTVVQPTGLTANINKANLNVSGVTASDKTYDGSSSASLSGTAAVSAIGSDVVSVSGAGVGSFADKNAGSNKAVSVSGYTLSGSDAGNYTVVQPTGLTANINKANLNVSGVTASDKTYDGSSSASLSGTAAVSAIGSDVVSVSGTGVGSFADKNAGSNKAVSVSGYTLSGSDAGNYTVVQPTGLTANINKANLNVSGVTASDKTYDGSASASLSGTAAVSAIGSDVVSVSGTGVGSFADKNAGSNKSVSVSGYTLSGSDAGNYTVVQPTGLTANILQAQVTVSGITANNKTFDGGTAASVVTSGAVLSGKLSTDQVTISATGTFADAAVGTGKTVNLVSSYGGSDAGNYLFTSQASTQADITPAPVLPSNPATPSSLVTQQIQNTVTQVQSSMLPPQAASQPQALNLSSTLTIKQESGTDPGQSSANDKTKGNAANGLVTSTVAIGSGGPVLQILNGGTQLSDNAARITE